MDTEKWKQIFFGKKKPTKKAKRERGIDVTKLAIP